MNDGKAQSMSCCPLKGKRIFSTKAEDLFIARTGLCLADEILTGMADPGPPSIYCSKLNGAYLERGPVVPSVYVAGTQPGVLGQIAASYHASDTCICPEGTVALGGHTIADNQCAEQCAPIRAKKVP